MKRTREIAAVQSDISSKLHLKRDDKLYLLIEDLPSDELEESLYFEIYVRLKPVLAEIVRGRATVYTTEELRVTADKREEEKNNEYDYRIALYQEKRKEFFEMLRKTKENQKDKWANETEVFYEELIPIKMRFEEIRSFIMRTGRNGKKKTRQEKAADFFFIWDSLRGGYQKKYSNLVMKAEHQGIRVATGLAPITYQRYREHIEAFFMLGIEDVKRDFTEHEQLKRLEIGLRSLS